MKKVIIILLLALAIAQGTTGCENTSNEVEGQAPETVGFHFTHMQEARGQYNKPGFGEKYGIYRFEGTDIVVYNINVHSGGGYYLIGEDREAERGPSWGDVASYDTQFLALSNTYMLFLTRDGKVAKGLEEEKVLINGVGHLVHETILFDELPLEEQEAFVYPSSYEVVENGI